MQVLVWGEIFMQTYARNKRRIWGIFGGSTSWFPWPCSDETFPDHLLKPLNPFPSHRAAGAWPGTPWAGSQSVAGQFKHLHILKAEVARQSSGEHSNLPVRMLWFKSQQGPLCVHVCVHPLTHYPGCLPHSRQDRLQQPYKRQVKKMDGWSVLTAVKNGQCYTTLT